MMDSVIEVQGKQLKLSNLEKVLYPAVGFTKKDVIDYYVRIAPAIIPHLAGRALTRKRYPDGVEGEPFFEKNAPMHRPDWVKTVPIWSDRNRRTVHYVAGQSGRARTAPVTFVGQRHYLPHDDGLRSGPGPSREHCPMLPGRFVVARDL
jgi:DNA primase